MIAANTPFQARYKHEITDNYGKPCRFRTHLPIVAWDDTGDPLVADEKTGRLVPANRWRNFDGVDQGSDDLVSLIPGGGWRVELTESGGNVWSEPLVGWALRQDGAVVALSTDSAGVVEVIDHHTPFNRIYHPDTSELGTKEHAA